MQVRLVIFLVLVALGFLYVTYLNPEFVPVTLLPDMTVNLPVSVALAFSFIAGVLTVMLLYFQDTITDTFMGFKRSSQEKRTRRVAQLHESGMEKLLIEKRKDAMKLFEKALAHDRSYVPSLLALGKMRREDGEVNKAIKIHSKAKGLAADNISAHLELAEDYIDAEQFTNAVSILEEAQKLAGKSLPPLKRVRDIFLRVGNIQEAISTQQKIVSFAPRDQIEDERKMLIALLYEGALEKLAEQKYTEARSGLSKVISNDSKFVPAYLKLAETHERMGGQKEAVKTLERGFKVTNSLIILKALDMFLLAKGEIGKVVENYKWAKSILPNQKVIRLFLAEAHLRNAEYEEARREIDSLNGALSDLTLYHLIEGEIRRHENNKDQALESMGEAYQREVATFFHFSCSKCGHMSLEYSGRCRSCEAWNSLQPLLY